MREKTQTHLTMMSRFTVRFAEQEKRFEDQEKRFAEQERRFTERLGEQEKRFEDQEKKFVDQEKRLAEQERRFTERLGEQEKKSSKLYQDMQKILAQKRHGKETDITVKKTGTYHYFIIEDYILKIERAKQEAHAEAVMAKAVQKVHLMSPAMYTHTGGYKFCIGVDITGSGAITVALWSMQGEYDERLKWPVTADFTIELVNHYPNGKNRTVTNKMTWHKPKSLYKEVSTFSRKTNDPTFIISDFELFPSPSKQQNLLCENGLHFKLKIHNSK